MPGWPALVDMADTGFLMYRNWIDGVADVDLDSLPEVSIHTAMGPYIFNHDGTRLFGAAPLHRDYTGQASMSDVDGDGDVDMLIGISGYAYVYDFAGHARTIEWARYRADLGNTAAHRPLDCNGNGISDARDILGGTSTDCDTNGIPDECDLPGDFNGDGHVEMEDYSAFMKVFFGPAVSVECSVADLDKDADIDLRDYARFQVVFGQ